MLLSTRRLPSKYRKSARHVQWMSHYAISYSLVPQPQPQQVVCVHVAERAHHDLAVHAVCEPAVAWDGRAEVLDLQHRKVSTQVGR